MQIAWGRPDLRIATMELPIGMLAVALPQALEQGRGALMDDPGTRGGPRLRAGAPGALPRARRRRAALLPGHGRDRGRPALGRPPARRARPQRREAAHGRLREGRPDRGPVAAGGGGHRALCAAGLRARGRAGPPRVDARRRAPCRRRWRRRARRSRSGRAALPRPRPASDPRAGGGTHGGGRGRRRGGNFGRRCGRALDADGRARRRQSPWPPCTGATAEAFEAALTRSAPIGPRPCGAPRSPRPDGARPPRSIERLARRPDPPPRAATGTRTARRRDGPACRV